ncbi:Protein of unknown function [Bacillus cereus]|nr:Protein of unknown function [Bacillus cereus]
MFGTTMMMGNLFGGAIVFILLIQQF